MKPRVLIEVCVDSIESALAAQAGGAGRIELCANLVEGGTTPSAGTITACRKRLQIPLFVLVRPRGGDFLYSEPETEAMLHDITVARDLAADGVVIGALRPDGTVDEPRVAALVQAARPMAVTFHRAFDVCPDVGAALETLAALTVDRVLTTGQAPTARQGIPTLAALVRQSAGRVVILAGGSLDETTAPLVVAATGVAEVHLRATEPFPSPMTHRPRGITVSKPHTPDDYTRLVASTARIQRLNALLNAGN